MKPDDLAVGAWRRFCLKLRNGGFREGVIVWFRSPQGQMHAGEASPLPGWSPEDLTDVIFALENNSRDFSRLPSLLFAREMAWNSLSGWQGHPSPAPEAPLAALIAGDAKDWIPRASSAVAAGARTLKMKISPESAVRLPDFFHYVEREFSLDVQVRLDANRSLEITDFLRLADQLPGHRVEFVEEPLREFHRLPEITGTSPLSIALDETLREIRPEELDKFQGVGALVFKPTLMGGWEACSQFSTRGHAMGAKTVLSAAFESGLGIATLAELALRHSPDTAAGLDTYSFLEDDILARPLNFSSYRIRPFLCPPINEQNLD